MNETYGRKQSRLHSTTNSLSNSASSKTPTTRITHHTVYFVCVNRCSSEYSTSRPKVCLLNPGKSWQREKHDIIIPILHIQNPSKISKVQALILFALTLHLSRGVRECARTCSSMARERTSNILSVW